MNSQADLALGIAELYAPTPDSWESALSANDKLVVYCAAAAIIATIRSMASPTSPGEIGADAVAARFGMTHAQLDRVVCESASMKLRARLRWKDPVAKTTLAVAMPEDIVQRIFLRWLNATERSHARLGPKRRARIEARLAEGISPAMLMRAIDGIAASRWHRGENDRGQRYDTIEVVFRDSAAVERFAEMAAPKRHDAFDRIAEEAERRRGE